MVSVDFLKNIFEKEIKKKQFPVFARVTKVYTENNQNYVDCKKMDVDFTESTIIFTKILIPQYWGTSDGGIGIIPDLDSIVTLTFIGGDINFPVISSVIGIDCDIVFKKNELLIQKKKSQIKLSKDEIEYKVDESKISIKKDLIELNSGTGKISIKNKSENLKDILEEVLREILMIKLDGTCSNGGTFPMVTIQFNPSKSIEKMINNLMN